MVYLKRGLPCPVTQTFPSHKTTFRQKGRLTYCAVRMQAVVAEVDSHPFFQQLQACRAVMVYLKKGPGLPSHADLATSLRQKEPIEDRL